MTTELKDMQTSELQGLFDSLRSQCYRINHLVGLGLPTSSYEEYAELADRRDAVAAVLASRL